MNSCKHSPLNTPLTYRSLPIRQIATQIDCLPGDKSISHRAVLLGALANGTSQFTGFLSSSDCLATLSAVRALGVRARLVNDLLEIQGTGLASLKASPIPIDCGNAGTLCRLLMGVVAQIPGKTILIGDTSLSKRPMARVITPLRQMGACIDAVNNQLPAVLTGKPLQGIEYALPIPSAQIKSCLLLAGLGANGETVLTIPGIARDHTEKLLQSMGYPITIAGQTIRLSGGHPLRPVTLQIPSDFSSAAFWIVLAVGLKQAIEVRDVGVNRTRVGLLHLLQSMGVGVTLKNYRYAGLEPIADIHIQPPIRLQGITVTGEAVAHAIDEIPIFCILAAIAVGKTVIMGAKELTVKESNRLARMEIGLRQLGIDCELLEDGLMIEGGVLHGGVVESGGDHRIAMAFLIAGCFSAQSICVTGCEWIETSYPRFFQDGKRFGANWMQE